jgi:transcriptional regulator with XRE-family HTH domain
LHGGMVDYKQVLAENIKRIRDELDLTQEDLAYEADIDRTYISGIERAKRNPSLTLIVKLAKELKTTPAALLTPAKK